MSLINEMLRDLDSREASQLERGGLDQHIRALPKPKRFPWHLVTLVLTTAIVSGGAVWFLNHQDEPIQPVKIAVVPKKEAAPVPLPPVHAPMPDANGAEPLNPAAQSSTLRLDHTLPTVPENIQPRSPQAQNKPTEKQTAPSPTKSKETSAPAPLTASSDLHASAAIKPANNNQAQISKSSANGGTANEQAEAEYRRGYAAVKRGATNEAIEAFSLALRADGKHAAARQALLSIFVEQKQWQQAEALAHDGVALMPARSDWALISARIQYDRSDLEGALGTMTLYAPGAKKNADFQVFHALLLQRVNRYAEAASCYQTALEIRPTEGRWWYGLGRALDADHRETEARQAYEKARDAGNLTPELLQLVEKRLR